VLLDSLRLVDLDTLRNELIKGLERLQADEEIGEPALLLPERNLSSLLTGKEIGRSNAVAYEHFHPGAEISVTPGSEGFIGGLLRDFARAGKREKQNRWIAPDADMEQLRTRRCRTIVIVADYCGSGKQALTIAESLVRNKSIRSWRSLHRVEIHLFAFAASVKAQRDLVASSAIDAVHTVEPALTFETAGWSEEVDEAIKELCDRESRVPRYARGFRRSSGLFATARAAPNNLPAIFWQSAADWQPLFPGRKVPPTVAEDFGGYRPTEPLPDLAARVGQMRVGRNERLKYMRRQSRDLLGALLSLRDESKDVSALAADLKTTTDRAKTLIETLEGLGFIADNKVTADGRREIKAQKRALRRSTAGLHGTYEPYYPHALSEGEART
jgi:hypothetical protein